MKNIVFAILGLGLLASVVNLIGVPNDGIKKAPENSLPQEEFEVPKTTSFESLNLAATDPSGGHYTISILINSDLKGLDAERKFLETESIPFRILEVVEENGNNWYLLTAGEYKNDSEAQRSRAYLESRLDITGKILWFPSKELGFGFSPAHTTHAVGRSKAVPLMRSL
jgi:hypothetical protein